ncbi:MAG TPA: glutamine--fructose-6-phosphate aminotransferase, partial [Planctomycetaceae bacterium]|nr:glutamine--fructose-6-phosphate aminotransferase [Planctomycetaceae bacterium]
MASLYKSNPVSGTAGIGHTRWATHGETNDQNSHPHVGGNADVVIVHNGVIENYTSLRKQLQGLGYVFRTTTDTESVAHLLSHHLEEQIKFGSDPEELATYLKAVEITLTKLKGTYGLVVMFRDLPDVMIAARLGSPLVIGVGKGEHFIASDATPLAGYTDEVIYLADHEMAVITRDEIEIFHRDEGQQKLSIQTLDQVSVEAELGEFEHYMLKEIFE